MADDGSPGIDDDAGLGLHLMNDDNWDETLDQINRSLLPSVGGPDATSPGYQYSYGEVRKVQITFPYTAYRSQEQMMEKIIQGVQNGENCLLESPTGTGKTAALLCALLAWQKDCYDRNDNCSEIMAAAAERLGGCTCGLIIDKDKTKVLMEPVRKEWFLVAYTPKDPPPPSTPTHGDVSIDTSIDSNDISGLTTLAVSANGHSNPTTPIKIGTQSPSNSGSQTPKNSATQTPVKSATQTPIKSATQTPNKSATQTPNYSGSPTKRRRMDSLDESYHIERKHVSKACAYCLKKFVYDRSRPPKIYYLTRTHSQISQVVSQLKRTAYKDSRMTILASRVPTCISESALKRVEEHNSTQKDLRNQTDINEVCRGLKKNYYKLKREEENMGEEAFKAWKQKQDPNSLRICEYFAPMYELRDRFCPSPAWDFEDIKRDGICARACPYYGCYSMHEDSNIVFGAYNYLLDPSLREVTKVKHINSVLVFDEAHNIEDICRRLFSFVLNVTNFEERVLGLVNNLIKIHNDSLPETFHIKHSTITALRNLSEKMEQWVHWITERGRSLRAPRQGEAQEVQESYTNDRLNEVLEEMGMNIDTIDKCLSWAAEAGSGVPATEQTDADFEGDNDESKDEFYTDGFGKKPFKLSYVVADFLKKMRMSLTHLRQDEDGIGGPRDFKGVLTRSPYRPKDSGRNRRRSNALHVVEKEKKEFDFTFELVCLNPAIGFSALKKSAYSIIVASGTLTPLDSFSSELATTFKVTLQAEHVIPLSRFRTMVVSTGPSGMKLQLTKDHQNDPEIQDEIGKTLCEICEIVPNGVLVFLPSYGLMRKLESRWTTNGVFQRIQKRKKIFFEESHDKKKFKQDMERYKEMVKGGIGWDGCILFAVFRGKISEGIDFADEQARAVVSIGIPYSNLGSADVRAKREYNDMRIERRRLGELFLSGSQWYTTQAFRALNQGLGRCVRHRYHSNII